MNLLALIGTLTFKTPKPFLYLYYSILCIEILEWRCCCATDCGTSNVRISMFLKKTVSGVSKFLYFRPILRMSATDRQPLYSNRSQSVARTHSLSFKMLAAIHTVLLLFIDLYISHPTSTPTVLMI